MTSLHETFQLLITHIETNRQQPITLEDLTEVSDLSRFQVIRLFYGLCGMTPMEYVRARRLAGSIPQLLLGDRILDVALNWGFEYEQSYIRAFREAYHITPARFRRQQSPIPIVEPPRLTGFTMSANGMLGNPKILARPAFDIMGDVKPYNYADNLMDGTPLHDGITAGASGVYTAACRPSRTDPFTHHYLIEASGGLQVWHWPAGEWARFQYIGLHPLNREGIKRIRLMTSLVVGSWYSQRRSRWDGSFIEQITQTWPGENYCQVILYCPLTPYFE